jgi:hypothetical protein
VNGYFIAIIFGIFDLPTIAGSLGRSFAGSVTGLLIPWLIAWLYQTATGKEGVGGGTIKLSAFVGNWAGLLIVPILIIATLILIIQGVVLLLINALPGELKWKGDTLVPRLHKRIKVAIPTSAAFYYSTWLLLVFSAIKCANHNFLGKYDSFLHFFLTF